MVVTVLDEAPEVKPQHIQAEVFNPLLSYHDLIPFDQIKPRHFVPAFEMLVQKVEPQLSLLENRSNPSWVHLF